MFGQILYVHWRAARFALLPFVVAAFGLPLVAVQGLGVPRGSTPEEAFYVWRVFDLLQLWLPLFPALAAGTGAAVALAVWNWDHRGDHAYALTIPLPRRRYALLKMAAGGLLLAVPFLAFWTGSLAASLSLTLPEGLHAYPTLLAVRFLLAMLLAYALLFALASGTIRLAVLSLTGFALLVVVGALASDVLVEFFPALRGWSFIEWLFERLTRWPGPFEVFTGSWMLIDV